MGGEVFLGRVTQGSQKSCQVQFMQHGDLKHMKVMTVTSVIISIGYKHIVCNSQWREIHSTCS